MRFLTSMILASSIAMSATYAIGQEGNSGTGAQGEEHREKTGKMAGGLEDLQTAYFTASHEVGLYGKFAEKADAEGYGQVASLFRAMTRAEAIHMDKTGALIMEIGGTPKASTDSVAAGTTRENLEFAVASENYEATVMNASFVEAAKKAKNQTLFDLFGYTQKAEPSHLAVLQQGLNDLESYRGAGVNFQVCPTCGLIARSLKGAACPVCATPRGTFETVK